VRIFVRLLVGFLTVSVLGAAVAIAGMAYAIEFSDAAQNEYQKSTLGLVYLIDLADIIGRIRTNIRDYYRSTVPQTAGATADSIVKLQGDFTATAQKYPETIFDDKDKADYEALLSLFSDYSESLKQVFDLYNQQKKDELRALVVGELRTKENAIRTLLSQMTKYNGDYAKNFALTCLRRTNDMKVLLPALILAGVVLSVLIGFFISRSIVRPMQKIGKLAGDIAAGRSDPEEEAKGFSRRIAIHSKDEVAELGGHFNKLLEMLEDLLHRIADNAVDITGMVQGLSSSTQEINATANEQAAAVKEIVSTIEDTDQLSKNVSTRVGEVSRIANDTKHNVEEGFAAVQENISKMNAIHEANDRTIKGIHFLGEKIKNIWEIVNIINGIADQTKIIAFNAELEASSAGEAGRNFQIVASEIRRLADSTGYSTNEIKARIQEIERSSDSLLLSSEQGTEQIHHGKELSQKMSSLFADISSSADISDSSTQQIALAIRQQVESFGQIVVAIKQISQGVDNFVVATKATSATTEKLRAMSDNLASLLKRFEA
jgi:methyl-accepting chemotaxis protein